MDLISEAASQLNGVKGALWAIGLGGFLVFHAIRAFRKRRLIEDTATIPVRSAAVGLCEFQGYAWPVNGERETLDGRRCVYYDLVVEERRQRGKNSYWETIFSYRQDAPFLLTDGTGHCLVLPDAADCDLQERTLSLTELSDPARARLETLSEGLVSRGGGGFFGKAFSSARRVREKKILVGSPVYVRGDYQPYPSAVPQAVSPGLDRFLARALKYRGKVDQAKALFDLDGDGVVSDREMAIGHHGMAVGAMRSEPAHDDTQNSASQALIQGMIAKGSEHGLLIADVHENRLIGRLGSMRFYATLLGGALLLGFGISLLFRG